MMICTLPAHGYQLIRIDDDVGETDINKRLSKPEIVLGFVIVEQQGYLSVQPVTVFGIYRESCALLRPDGKVDVIEGVLSDHTFESIDDLKRNLLHFAAESCRECAADMAKDGDRKGAASMRRASKKLQEALENIE